MILGLLGVSYSTILLYEDGEMNVKVTNIKEQVLLEKVILKLIPK